MFGKAWILTNISSWFPTIKPRTYQHHPVSFVPHLPFDFANPSSHFRLTQQMLVPMVPGVAPGQPGAVPGSQGQPGMVPPAGTPPQGPGGSPTRAPAGSPQQTPSNGTPNGTPPGSLAGSLPPAQSPALFGHSRSQSPPPMAHHRSNGVQQVPVYAMNRRPAPPNGNVPVYALPSQPPSPQQEPMPQEPAPIETEGIMMEPQMGVATPDTPKSPMMRQQSGGLSVEIAQELGYLTSVAGAVGRHAHDVAPVKFPLMPCLWGVSRMTTL